MNVLSRFTRYTTQKEPVLSAGVLAAIVLAILSRFVRLTEDDLQLLGLLLVPIVTALVARLKAWSPASVERETRSAYLDGTEDGRPEARTAATPRPVPVSTPRPVTRRPARGTKP